MAAGSSRQYVPFSDRCQYHCPCHSCTPASNDSWIRIGPVFRPVNFLNPSPALSNVWSLFGRSVTAWPTPSLLLCGLWFRDSRLRFLTTFDYFFEAIARSISTGTPVPSSAGDSEELSAELSFAVVRRLVRANSPSFPWFWQAFPSWASQSPESYHAPSRPIGTSCPSFPYRGPFRAMRSSWRNLAFNFWIFRHLKVVFRVLWSFSSLNPFPTCSYHWFIWFLRLCPHGI